MVLIETHKQFIDSICAIIVKGHWNNLSKPKIGSTLTSTTIHQCILHLTQHHYEPFFIFSFFKWAHSIPHYTHSLQSSWSMLHILTKHRHFKTAHHVLDKIAQKEILSYPSVLTSLVRIHDDPEVNSHVLSWIVIHYAKSKMTHDAVQVFEFMSLCNLKPHLHACTVLMNSLLKEGVTNMVWKVYKRMVRDGVVPNIYIYNCLIHACLKSRDVERAEFILNEMEGKCVVPDIFTIRDANKLLNEMSEKKIQADNITCNTLINAYCKIGDLSSALKSKNKMVEAGLKPDPFTYKALIYGFCKLSELESAKELLFGMLDAGFSPSYCTYSWIVDGYCKKDNTDAVLALPDEFLSKGICLDVSVYRALIRRLSKIERIESAEKLLVHMEGKGISGDSVIYTSVAFAYWKSGNTNAASNVLEEMARRMLKINAKIYRCFSAPDASENKVSQMFWDHVVERGLMSRNTMYKIKQNL
ncbi:hypothetical protein RYX36_023967 [Vicia faba]